VSGAHQLLDFVRISNYLDWKSGFGSQHLGFVSQCVISSGKEDRLNIQFAPHQLAKDLRNVPAPFPACINEHSELVSVEAERSPRRLSGLLAWKIKLWMHGHA